MLKGERPSPAQYEYFCPFCKTLLLYVYDGKYLFGLCSDRWLYCQDCKKKFVLSQTNGFHQAELDEVIVGVL